jgi:hypothetical protein
MKRIAKTMAAKIISVSITGIQAHENECETGRTNYGFIVSWARDNGTFGEIRFTQSAYDDRQPQFVIDSEFMSREFVKSVLSVLVDSAYFPCEVRNDATKGEE